MVVTNEPARRASEGRPSLARRAGASERTPPTSRRKKAKAPAPQPAPAAPGPGPEVLRRVLLGLATALIVIRALVPGEDVGLLGGGNPLGLAVPLLWLCGLATWAAWRIWARQLDWYGGAIELGLLLLVFSSFVGTAFVASYKHPAWVVSWEWAGLLAAFFLVRQIARRPADQRGLLAALLAAGVTLAAQSLYERAVPDPGRTPFPGLTADELPRRRCEVLATFGGSPQSGFPGTLSLPALAAATSTSDPTLFERIATRNNVRPETGEPALPLALRPTPPRPPTATFTSPSNFAGFLALLLPPLAGCVLAAWRGGAPRWQRSAALGCALLAALALGLTRERSAILPCLLVGALAWVLVWGHYRMRPQGMPGVSERKQLLLGLVGPAALLLLAFLTGPGAEKGLGDLTREWSTAWRMIRDHFWLGVGAGNYGRFYPQYMAPTAQTFASQPSNFALEVWATLGLPAIVGLGVALVHFFRRTLPIIPDSEQGTEDEGPATRWEFYEGGMLGLLVGFLLRALPAGPDAIVAEAVAAVARVLIWFAAFAILQGIRWGGPTRVLACGGVAALLLHLAVTGGVSVPGVMQPLWVLAALTLNGLPVQPVPVGRHLVGRVLPLALATAAALLCALQLFQPTVAGASDDRTALAAGQKVLDVRSGVTAPQPEGKRERLRSEALVYIISQLEDAVQSDPGNARYWVDLANWYGTLYETVIPTNEEYRRRGFEYARAAEDKYDPLGVEGYLAESRLHELGTSRAPSLDLRRQAVKLVAEPLLKIVQARPNDARLHYRLAVALFTAEEPALGKVHAARALELDLPGLAPERRLTEAQRQQAERLVNRPTSR